MTPTRWRALSLLALAGLVAFAAALFLPSDVRQRLAGLGGTHAPSRTSPPERSDAPGDPRPGQPAPADAGKDPDEHGDTRRSASKDAPAGSSPIETLPDGRANEPARLGRADPMRGESGRSPEGPERETRLDIVRVEPNGDSVIAGRTRPNASVEFLRDDRPFARATADPNGDFALVPPPLPPGSSEIRYRAVAPDGREMQGPESVAVVIADDRTAKPLVALSTPDKPTEVLSRPEAPASRTAQSSPPAADPRAAKRPEGAAPRPESGPPQALAALPPAAPAPGAARGRPVQVVSIDAQEGGRLDVALVGTPGATLRLYLNDTMVASGQVGPDGKLAITIGRGVRAGRYQVRADQVEPGTGKVGQRAQVAFAFPEAASARGAPAGPQAPPAQTPERPDAPAEAKAGRAEDARRAALAPSMRSERATPEARRLDTNNPAAAGPGPAKPDAPSDATRAGAPSADPRTARRESAPGDGQAPRQPGTRSAAQADRPGPAPRPSDSSKRAAAPGAGDRPPPGPNVARAMPETIAPTPSREPARADTVLTPPQATERQAAGSEPARSDAAGAVFVPEIATAKITRGDNLWQISRRSYGSGVRYTVIFDANKDQIRNPDLIYPGQIFVLPRDEAGAKRG